MKRPRASRAGRALSKLLLLSAILVWPTAPGLRAQSIAEGKAVFTGKCAACHTIGSGKLIGPDLAGVTVRRQDDWLTRQIKEPQALIAEKDPIVMGLLQESNGVPMVPLGLTDVEIQSVIQYLKSTEGMGQVEAGVPPQYLPTLLVSLVLLLALTTVGLTAGARKKVPLPGGVTR